MSKVITGIGVVLGAAVWFLLFVILGFGLGTSFIAGGCTLAAALLAALMASPPVQAMLDVSVTTVGLLLGVATFVIMAVVLSISLWIDVVAALGVIGVYSIGEASGRRPRSPDEPAASASSTRQTEPSVRNGHNSAREAVGAR